MGDAKIIEKFVRSEKIVYLLFVPVKTCPALKAPTHGRIRCEQEENEKKVKATDLSAYPIDTRCQFKCDSGFQLRGSKVRNCLPLSRWDGLKVTCKRQ